MTRLGGAATIVLALAALSDLCFACSNPNRDALPSQATCTSPARDDCSFYRACLEPRYHCGPAGYPLGYGEKFCAAFSEKRDRFSPQGQAWMLDTMQCLQRALVPEAEGAPGAANTCAELGAHALLTHPECYVGNGFCLLHPRDWMAVVDIVGVRTLAESWSAFEQVIQTAGECGQLYLYVLSRLG